VRPEFGRDGSVSSSRRTERVRRRWDITEHRAIAPQLTAERRGRAPEYSGHGPNTRSPLTQARNLQTFLGLQLLVLIRFVHYNTLYASVLRFNFEPAEL